MTKSRRMTLRCALFRDFMQRVIILSKHEVGTVHINARKISVGRPEGQTSWERRSRWKNWIKMDIRRNGEDDMRF